MTDARFEDGGERPVYVVARDASDIAVISALLQDAVLPVTDLRYDAKRRRFAALVNRFRWEDRAAAEKAGRAYERVRAVLSVEDVRKVTSTGINRADKTTVLSVLSMRFIPGEDGTGRIEVILSGNGTLALEVEALEITLRDVTRPYAAPSGKAPSHRI